MTKKNLYATAHLVVSAIRVMAHQNGAPPSVENLAEALRFSLEESHFLCRRLHKLGIIDVVEGVFGTKLFVKDHLELENIPKEPEDDNIKDDIEKFVSSKKDYTKEIESFKAKQEKKKQDLFSEIDQKLKKQLEDQKD